MDIDDGIGHRKEFMGQVVRNLARHRTFCVAGECAIEVHSVDWGESRRSQRCREIQRWNQDQPSVNLLLGYRSSELHDRYLTLVLISVISTER
jgi:hypothetical protein